MTLLMVFELASSMKATVIALAITVGFFFTDIDVNFNP